MKSSYIMFRDEVVVCVGCERTMKRNSVVKGFDKVLFFSVGEVSLDVTKKFEKYRDKKDLELLGEIYDELIEEGYEVEEIKDMFKGSYSHADIGDLHVNNSLK